MWTHWEITKRRVHLIPCLYGLGCKRPLVLEMEDMVSVYPIIISITRLYIAINELQRDANIKAVLEAYILYVSTSLCRS